ncbi:YqaJ viral recombinase family protein [Bradyrhizobium erythrophlei]|uniref:Phage-related protein, predicted endonuclease n=1 Tax=Bradyrhizobium erythrophlei TaxID=1437360 RepID=A0A1M5NCU2_9BRAD|nr:YqaJ viral recombinase family protein [Bradyrhizobium erythrophlei]SHG87340.1 Phage-related protein, predicted endonuclease [Bradyrhizobium erythrophlei]
MITVEPEVGTFRSLSSITAPVVEKITLGTVERHPVTDRASWLRMRAADLTASDVASVCGVGYRSAMAVWAEKKGHIPPNGDSPILRRGRWFEKAIWEAITDERPEWQLRAAKVYLRAPALRFGATPDALAIDPARKGLVLIQGKVVAKPVFIADWLGGDREGTAPTVPLGYQLQTLSETMLAEAAFNGEEIHPVLAALVVDSFTAELHLIPVARHADAEQKILATVRQFWAGFDAGIQPAVDPTKDHDVVRKLFPAENGATLDLSSDNLLPTLIDERKRLGEEITVREKRRDAISTEIMFKLGDSSFALIAGGRKISCKVTNVKEAFRAAYSFRSIREVKVR